jgi:hypothetical protein
MKFMKTSRAQGLRNLRVALRRTKDGTDWRNGRDSGFPPCCRVYFTVRSISMDLWVIAFGNYGFFVDPSYQQPMGPAERKFYRSTHASHVLCWFHKLAYYGKDWSKAYHTCPTCNWQQFEVKECTRCVK